MNILAFSDLHRNRAIAERIAAEAEKADLVIGAGDFATHGEGLADTASLLQMIEPPMVIVAGNHDHRWNCAAHSAIARTYICFTEKQ